MPTPREAYVNDVQRQGYTNARLRPADFASGAEEIGRAAQRFGGELQQTAEVVTKIQERDAETAAQEADNIRLAKRLQRLHEGPDGYFNKNGRDALLDQEQLEKDLRQIDEEAAQTLENKPFARKMYDQLTVRRNANDMPSIYKHAEQQRLVYEDAVDANAFDLAIDNASNSPDPVVVEQNIITAGNIAAKQARRKGVAYDADSEAQARQLGIGKAVESIAQKMELQSPSEAQAFVTTNAHRMDPQDTARILDHLAPAASQERAGSDVANFMVYSGEVFPEGPVVDTSGVEVAPTPIPPIDAVAATVIGYETRGGAHTDASGNLITSYAGAQGAGQLMPKTGEDPGYGVKPLQNHSREEHIRFSKDLLVAYTKHFDNNIVLGLTAYNWGPGNLEAHIKKVGKPGVNGMTDAQFISTLPRVDGPNEAARTQVQRYAADVLSKTGVSVNGKPGPSTGKPVVVGREVNLEATINNIRNSDRSYVDKQALIAEATRMHSYGKQIKAEAAEALGDEVQTEINKMPVGGFTDVNQLPLTLRQKLPLHPELYNSVRNMAHTNQEKKEAEYDAKKKEIFEAKLGRLEQDLMAYMWNNPEGFKKIDFYTSPAWAKMGSDKVAYWMKQQQELIESGTGKGANHDAIRTMITRHTAKNMSDAKRGEIQNYVSIRENQILNSPGRNGKPLTDDERESLVRQAVTEATFVVNGTKMKGTRAEAAAQGARTSTVNIYDEARVQFQRRTGRMPLPAELEALVVRLRQEEAAKAQGGN